MVSKLWLNYRIFYRFGVLIVIKTSLERVGGRWITFPKSQDTMPFGQRLCGGKNIGQGSQSPVLLFV